MSDREINWETLKVPLDWTDGKEMTIEQWGHREYQCGLNTGRVQGLQEAAKWLMDGAQAAFANGDDKAASTLRNLSSQIKDKAK